MDNRKELGYKFNNRKLLEINTHVVLTYPNSKSYEFNNERLRFLVILSLDTIVGKKVTKVIMGGQ